MGAIAGELSVGGAGARISITNPPFEYGAHRINSARPSSLTPKFEVQSRLTEQSKVTASLMTRMRQCMQTDTQAAIFRDALREANISPTHLDGRQIIKQTQFNIAFRYAVQRVPEIGLRMFSRVEIADFGIVGYAAMNSETVGSALRFLNSYRYLISDRYYDRVTVTGERATITPLPIVPHIHDFKNIAEESMAMNWRVLKILMGDALDSRLARMRFDFLAPQYQTTYADVFDCPYEFGAALNELEFPAAWLDCRVATADQAIAAVCTAMCERLLGGTNTRKETPQAVRRLLLSRAGRRMHRLEEAADELRLSTSQLRKRLYRAGTTYRQLVLETRMALAEHYLRETNLDIQEIAYLLDYSQPAPFSRAFKSYFGVSPNETRARTM